jgi:hypothetical protein
VGTARGAVAVAAGFAAAGAAAANASAAAGALAPAGAADAPGSGGITIFALQCGQMPRLPARNAFTFSFLPQLSQ